MIFMVFGVCLVLCLAGTSNSAWIGNHEEENKFCQSLCDNCGCIGFGCGDQCLCECQQNKIDDKYITCIADARSISPKLDAMKYDIIIQGPNGANRVLRSVQSDLNSEDILPDFQRRYRGADDKKEQEKSENVAAPIATPTNINQGFKVLLEKQLTAVPIAPINLPNNLQIDQDAFRSRLTDLQSKFRSSIPALPAAAKAPVVAPAIAPIAKVEPIHLEPVNLKPVHLEPIHLPPVNLEPVHVEPVHLPPVKGLDLESLRNRIAHSPLHNRLNEILQSKKESDTS